MKSIILLFAALMYSSGSAWATAGDGDPTKIVITCTFKNCETIRTLKSGQTVRDSSCDARPEQPERTYVFDKNEITLERNNKTDTYETDQYWTTRSTFFEYQARSVRTPDKYNNGVKYTIVRINRMIGSATYLEEDNNTKFRYAFGQCADANELRRSRKF